MMKHTLTLILALMSLTLAKPIEPSLEHRQLGSCATAPCPVGLCCSQYDYCGTGADYCQAGSCVGGVGGTCAPGLCCSPFGYCGSGAGFCPPTTTTTPASTTPTSTTTPTPTGTICPNAGKVCDPGTCCSKFGWCGSGPAFCG